MSQACALTERVSDKEPVHGSCSCFTLRRTRLTEMLPGHAQGLTMHQAALLVVWLCWQASSTSGSATVTSGVPCSPSYCLWSLRALLQIACKVRFGETCPKAIACHMPWFAGVLVFGSPCLGAFSWHISGFAPSPRGLLREQLPPEPAQSGHGKKHPSLISRSKMCLEITQKSGQ